MEADPTKAYNQDDATGFIRLNALRLKVAAKVHGRRNRLNVALTTERKMKQAQPFSDWYQTNRQVFDRMASYSCSVLSSLLSEANIAHLNVSYRVKDLKSAAEKVERKGYADPIHEMTDIVGIRIITYIEADTQKASAVVKSAFRVHDDKSLDKSAELGVDKLGYRSIHYVCDIGVERAKLPECVKFKEVLFEIQIRSVLQHAWLRLSTIVVTSLVSTAPTPRSTVKSDSWLFRIG
jgi:ppGpp synthetase/RelA/SpoT-type nucleotidyltranferase